MNHAENLLHPLSAQTLVRGQCTLASPPELYVRTRELADDPKSSAEDIGQVIGTDPGMTARLLRIVNSPFYGFPSQIDTIPRAISIIGTSALLQLVLVTTVVKAFDGISDARVNMGAFWAHSLYTGMAAQAISKRQTRANSDAAFIAGLLHDIGRLVLYMQLPDPQRQVLLEAEQNSLSLAATENELLGFDHAEVGGELARLWGLPDTLAYTLEFHHLPDKTPGHAELVRAVHVADGVTHCVNGDASAAHMSIEQLLTRVSLSPESADEILAEIDAQFAATYRSFFGRQPPSPKGA